MLTKRGRIEQKIAGLDLKGAKVVNSMLLEKRSHSILEVNSKSTLKPQFKENLCEKTILLYVYCKCTNLTKICDRGGG